MTTTPTLRMHMLIDVAEEVFDPLYT